MTLRIGTRGSALALYQARAVAGQLLAVTGVRSEIVVIKTSGDRLADAVLSDVGGKGLFVKEIEEALLAHDVDLAVHSSKDLPNELPTGLGIRAVLPRGDARDAMVLPLSRGGPCDVADLAPRLGLDPVIGTSSVRRIAQLRRLFPNARFQAIRGNLDTRLRKLDEGQYDALVLAAAGLQRLQYTHRITTALPLEACIPAPGQGIIAIETRQGDAVTESSVARLNDARAGVALIAEREVVARLGGGCQLPIGAHAAIADGCLVLTAIVIAPDGSRHVQARVHGTPDRAQAIGGEAADDLLARGAGDILAAVRRSHNVTESQP